MMSPWRRIAVAVVVGGLIFLFTAFYPFRQLRSIREDVARSHTELVEVDRERARLEERARQLLTPLEIERLARERFGLARPGEIPYVVVPEEPRR